MPNSTVLSVSQLNRYIKSLFEQNLQLKDVFIRGEISNFKGQYASGHLYFTLKDKDAAVKAVMFRNFASRIHFTPENGMTVLVRGEVGVYDRDGVYQIYCREMQPDGIGDLSLAFEQLKKKLSSEGLFDPAHKKPIPRFPQVIGIITAKSGAALQDMLNILRRRYPLVTVLVRSVLVQGEKSAADLKAAIRQMDELGLCDLLIIGRGGGSLEDLWSFNDEALAREIFCCRTPIISAVGHEVDFTICDFTADLRAPTPSAAAELAVPDKKELEFQLFSYERQMVQKIENRIHLLEAQFGRQKRVNDSLNGRLSALQAKIEGYQNHQALRSPYYALAQVKARVEEQISRLNTLIPVRLERETARLGKAAGILDSLSPFKVMSRGFSVITMRGKMINSTHQLKAGDYVTLRLADGTVPAQILQGGKGSE